MTARPSILAVTSELPWPLDSGGHLRSYHLLRGLARTFEVRLVAGCRGDAREGRDALRAAGIDVDEVQLPPDTPLRRLAGVAAAFARRRPYVMYERHHHAVMRRAISRGLRDRRPDAVYLDHLDSAVFADLAGAVPIVADMHNVYSLLAARAGDEHPSPWHRAYLRHEAGRLRGRELALARRADLMFAVSSEECGYFRQAGARDVHLVPNGVDCAAFRALPTGRRATPPVILYLGTMSWTPNAAAARFLADEVLPRVRERIPDARLRVVGKNPPEDLRRRHGRAGVEVTGAVPDVVPHLGDATLLAVPLEAGGGTRLKILEAFAAGVPVVSTPVGAEGIDAVSGRHLVITSRQHFADRIVELLAPGGADRVEGLASEGRRLARTRYDWPVVAAAATAAIERMLDRRRAAVPNGGRGELQPA